MDQSLRAESNRANAQKSTGPSPEGLRRTRLNASKHNLTGQTLILRADEIESYNRLSVNLLSELKPKTELERQIVQKIIDAHARLNRIASVENNIFNSSLLADIAGTQYEHSIDAICAQADAWVQRSASFDTLGRYEARIARQVPVHSGTRTSSESAQGP
jgi:hypothetical protein